MIISTVWFLQMVAPFGDQTPQLVLALQRSPELGHVFLPHAGGPLEVVGLVGGDPGNHQHGCGCLEACGASEGMRAPPDHPATRQRSAPIEANTAAVSATHVDYAAAGLAG